MLACAFLARVLRTAGASLEGVLSGTQPASLRSYRWGSYKSTFTVSGSSYDVSLPGLTAQKAAEIFRRATVDQGWLIITYGPLEDTPEGGTGRL